MTGTTRHVLVGVMMTALLAARGATPSAFERRCIPSGGVAPPSNIPDILGRRALPAGRIAALGATMDLHHGLPGAGRAATAAGVDDAPAAPRVRSSNPSIAMVIKQAIELSKAFRGLVETISASDGTVYVEKGQCGRGVRACLVAVTMAGANRNLWVKVDARMRDWDLMGAIGHELQHAVEVLSDRTVTNNVAMFFFYQRTGRPHPKHFAFETDAAIEAGEAVRAEVRKSSAR